MAIQVRMSNGDQHEIKSDQGITQVILDITKHARYHEIAQEGDFPVYINPTQIVSFVETRN